MSVFKATEPPVWRARSDVLYFSTMDSFPSFYVAAFERQEGIRKATLRD